MRIQVRDLERTAYASTFDAMQQFTAQRTPETIDEIWWTEHDPVFTQGQAGRAEHVLDPGEIPVVQTDRGGQITYHGPGQLVGYLLIDLKRSGLGPRTLVTCIERSLIAVLEEVGIRGVARADAPGVYVDGAKIAALGLRIRRGCSYHGLSLNVNMSLEPFTRINPCGLIGVDVTQTADLGGPDQLEAFKGPLGDQLIANLDGAARGADTPGDG